MNKLKQLYRNNKKMFDYGFYFGFAIGMILMVYLIYTGKVN